MLHLFGILKSVVKKKTRTKETLNLTSYKNKLQFECIRLLDTQYYTISYTTQSIIFPNRWIDSFQGLCTLWFGGFATSPLASVLGLNIGIFHRGMLVGGTSNLDIQLLYNSPGSPRPNKDFFLFFSDDLCKGFPILPKCKVWLTWTSWDSIVYVQTILLFWWYIGFGLFRKILSLGVWWNCVFLLSFSGRNPPWPRLLVVLAGPVAKR